MSKFKAFIIFAALALTLIVIHLVNKYKEPDFIINHSEIKQYGKD